MFHVVLVQPEIPPNTGNVIRLCANTGCTLHLVKPLGGKRWESATRRILHDGFQQTGTEVHGFDYVASFPTEVAEWPVKITAPDRLEPWHKRHYLPHVAEKLSRCA